MSSSADDAAPPTDGRNETPNQKLDRNWAGILQELRVAQTGTQIVSGFLLTLAFQQRFTQLQPYELVVYLTLVGLAAISTILGLAPVSMHRMYFHRGLMASIVAVGNRFLIAQLIVVALLAIGVTGFIADFVLGDIAGIVAAAFGLCIVLVLWLLLPRAGAGRSAG